MAKSSYHQLRQNYGFALCVEMSNFVRDYATKKSKQVCFRARPGVAQLARVDACRDGGYLGGQYLLLPTVAWNDK